MLQVISQVHRGHPALTDLALDAVAALKGGVQAGDVVGHALNALVFINRVCGDRTQVDNTRPRLIALWEFSFGGSPLNTLNRPLQYFARLDGFHVLRATLPA